MLIAFAVPMIISTKIGQQIHFPKMILLQVIVLILAGIWAIGYFFSERPRIRRSPMSVPIVLFLAAAAVATVFSMDPSLSFYGKFRNAEGLVLLLVYGALYFLAMQVDWSNLRLIRLAQALVAGGVLIGAYGVLQHFGWDFISWNKVPFTLRRSFATFGNPSLLGGYMTLVMALSIGLYLAAKKLGEQILMGAIVGLSMATILFTYTRSGWLGSLVVILILAGVPLVRILRKVDVGRDLKGFLKPALALTAVIVVVGTVFLVEPIIRSGSDGGATSPLSAEARFTIVGDSSIEDRVEIWKSALFMIASRPLVGQGTDLFQLRFGQFQTLRSAQVEKASAHAEDAHNYTMAVASTMGLLGMAGFLAVIFSLIGFGLSRRSYLVSKNRDGQEKGGVGPPPRKKKSKKREYGRQLAEEDKPDYKWTRMVMTLAVFAAAIGYFVDVSFTLNVVGGASMFWLMIGVIGGLYSREKRLEPASIKTRDSFAWPGVIVSSLVVGLGVYMTLSWLVADYRYGLAKSTFTVANQVQSKELAFQARDLFYEALELNPRMDRYMSDLSQFMVRTAVSSNDRDFWREAEIANNKGMETRPLEPWFHVNAGVILMTKSRGNSDYIDDAEDAFKKALDLYPNSARGHYFYGIYLNEYQRFPESREQFLLAQESDPTYLDNTYALGRWYQLAAARAEAGTPDAGITATEAKAEAIDLFEQVLDSQPDHTNALSAMEEIKT